MSQANQIKWSLFHCNVRTLVPTQLIVFANWTVWIVDRSDAPLERLPGHLFERPPKEMIQIWLLTQ